MILLRPDCLVFETPAGNIPCSVKKVSVELMGAAGSWLDEEVVQDAAMAVLHYFKEILGRTSVSLAEFAQALEQALNHLGMTVKAAGGAAEQDGAAMAEADLLGLAFQCSKGCELFFFPSLREELRRKLGLSPRVLCFRRLRVCVKQLIGTKRWNRQCQRLNDQIVDYLRACLGAEKGAEHCALVVL